MNTLKKNHQSFQEYCRSLLGKTKSKIKSTSILVVILLTWITLMTSCGVFFHGPGYERGSNRGERHERGNRQHNNDRHDHDDRR